MEKLVQSDCTAGNRGSTDSNFGSVSLMGTPYGIKAGLSPTKVEAEVRQYGIPCMLDSRSSDSPVVVSQ